ncbi:MAG: thiamine pyrophosphate binding domain-containing protein [Lachnospiraceae bacterium]|nr:thiamine pyrophosphate binding domain-containing protein [Lachnospiraceae bacterium]
MGMYSTEKNVQILIAVLKANHIKKVVVSPGTTNISFIVSMMNDGGFEMYSAVDERGAAYMACGLSSESGEPVVITCTGATASRNYFPGLTEAYHRKIPILAVTASQDLVRCGNLSPQFIDRTVQPNDSVRISVQVPIVRNNEDEYDATLKINRAVLELFRHGGGPAHINLASSYTNAFSVEDLSHVRIIKRYYYNDRLPQVPKCDKIAIIVGNHKQFSEELTHAIDIFCGLYNALVIVDHSSHYWGKYRILPTIVTCQEQHRTDLFDFDLLIHIGEEHGDYYTEPIAKAAKNVWRVSPDGEIRDPFRKLSYIFEMNEEDFFNYYTKDKKNTKPNHEYYDSIRKEVNDIYLKIPDLPFSNIWIAQQVIPKFPADACLELGVSNTMRSWTFFDFPKETYVLANTGCRGIDGAVPTLLGMSLACSEKIHYAVMGDLTFFYSFNVLGNRHVGRNLRILLVNNGCGQEFNIYPNRAYRIFEGNHDRINEYIAAGGHTGTKSKQLVKHFAEDLGFKYMTASSKEDFIKVLPIFMNDKMNQSMLFEVFTDVDDENDALKKIRNVKVDTSAALKSKIKSLLGR